jgi:M-phase inducer tyrosine phosphatase
MHRYPALTYPDIYVLEGGYSAFFDLHKLRCEPQNYVEMDDETHKHTCEREMRKFRRNGKFFHRASIMSAPKPEGPDSSPSARVASRRMATKRL